MFGFSFQSHFWSSHLPSCSQAYKGSATSFHVQNLQPSSDYRFRVCAIRQCQDAPELSGPYSPTVTLSPQRNDTAVGGGAASSGSRATTESNRARRSLTDEQCAFLLLMVFAVIAILIAFVIQYFVIKWAVCATRLQGYSFILPHSLCCFVSFVLYLFFCFVFLMSTE